MRDSHYKRIKHQGLQKERLIPRVFDFGGKHVNREYIFAETWQKAQKRISGVNGGYGTLELILNTNPQTGFVLSNVEDITERDAAVAATVIQWLGTNCGQAFLMEVKGKIDKANEEIRELKGGAK